jgi:16S rRNA (cytidine1402-2'-O)-methyltransferase
MQIESISSNGRGVLYIVATPIGNLEDITLRALRVLKEVDGVFAEDTRVAKKLLQHYEIKKPIHRYDEHIAESIHDIVLASLQGGNHVALVSDAGTPGISDPGSRLVAYIREHAPEVHIIPIPGPSALITALSVAGISADEFTFLGFSPHKKGRKTFFEKIHTISTRPVVLYESPHRLTRTLTDLMHIQGTNTPLVIVKELTKIHEDIWHGTVEQAMKYFVEKKGKGEFVLILE